MKQNETQEQLYNRWKQIKNKQDVKSKQETEEIEKELANEYLEKIEKAAGNLDGVEGGLTSKKLWDLKKNLCPRSRDPPTAMLDPKWNLVKDEEKIRELAADAYEKRLENKTINPGLEHIKDSKEELATKLMKVASKNQTPTWNKKNLEKVLDQLKRDKSRDPSELANKIFKNDVAGDDLKKALLLYTPFQARRAKALPR